MNTPENQSTFNITHIYHSGVMIETEEKLLIFDYFHENGAFDEKEFLKLLRHHGHKDFYYFATHGHPDHFTQKILTQDFQSSQGMTRYVFSDDLKTYHQAHSNITLCRSYQDFVIDGLRVKTFGSTDQGVSYLIEIPPENKLIFHSGDLNWWHWKNFSEEEKLQEKKDFLAEINKLKNHLIAKNSTLDIGFVPIDPRLEEFYALAGNAFLKEITPKIMFPLHFRKNYSITKEYKSQCNFPEIFQSIAHPLEHFILQY
ncbi:MBL fold metallo-hydrolase [Isachenkonia alkalipeptolytica]|uniref:MBL fold metallo-hydrolase n=1 Tax=Isachenkonia alkalipeptolytica TaxID=2565777 RepID=A0AA43XM24_9CLOT|nr:MBL fold metallo-hydrolase [Isachenkonia alkalipeptolytica]NBG89177.1 MBL fold metallo-hydrolase [Isachenkonia alkalipeptolytica]